MFQISLDQILKSVQPNQNKNNLTQILGPKSAVVNGISDPQTIKLNLKRTQNQNEILTYLSDLENLELLGSSSRIIVADVRFAEKITAHLLKNGTQDVVVLTTTNVKETMSILNRLFDPRSIEFEKFTLQSESKVFEKPLGHISKDAKISPDAAVHKGVFIGSGASVSAGAVIEAGAIIDENVQIRSGAIIGVGCYIGKNSIIGEGTVIGSDGFGFIPQKNSRPTKITQIGFVYISEDVELGGNCVIDRGTLGATFIGSGTKFDNLCHVAHNCYIGENGLIAGGFFMAGSSYIGNNFTCGGNVAIADHIRISDNILLGGRSAATKDILQPGQYCGFPPLPWKEGLRALTGAAHIHDLRERIAALERKFEKD